MICPECGYDKTKVTATITDIKVERYRKCPECGYSFLTEETVKADPYLAEYKEIQVSLDKKTVKR